MRFLLVTNATETCGVAEWGRQALAALRLAGVDVDVWYPQVHEVWPDLGPYDVVLVNHHPGTLGFLQPPPPMNFPPRLLVFKHEAAAGCPVGEKGAIFLAAEPHPGCLLFPMPCPSYRPQAQPVKDRIGTSSLRLAGVDWIVPVAEQLGLDFDWGQRKDLPPGKWLSTEGEIERLAACEALVFWYPGANAGQSSGVMMGVAAERPILLNNNRMFDYLRTRFSGAFYWADNPEEGLLRMLSDIRSSFSPRIPLGVKESLSWETLVPRLLILCR